MANSKASNFIGQKSLANLNELFAWLALQQKLISYVKRSLEY
jgi:hypothetical protein